ncbi:DUF805 domain-containing protein [Methylomonas methanica]|uniref:DUF805 domain-containing protein n=1 Tax=Methylomonas methanica (strain DSM 25384 / MC09) TaxID=857087 RepID=G0A1Z7_METMM|nr:DUF805 domain-containing protein [Methylomonas methanica]AEG01380.1 protein of unknown function DUF805 [Methylomonas methanica MC09]
MENNTHQDSSRAAQQPSQRYNRASFFALGVLPAINAIGLLLYGLGLETSGRSSGHSLPALIVLAILCLLVSLYAAVKRGHDLGWPAWQTTLAYVFSMSMGPVALLLISYFACARGLPSANEYGAAPPASFTAWFWAIFVIVCSGFVLATAARIL